MAFKSSEKYLPKSSSASFRGNLIKIPRHSAVEGQVLLIIVMLMATVITVVMSLTFKSTTDTQITKLQEESQKALAAAEAGLEKGLKSSIIAGSYTSFSGLGLSGLSGIDLQNSSVSIYQPPAASFVSPLLNKDEQYTFYLSNFDPVSQTFSESSLARDLMICFGSSSAPALELTLVKGSVFDTVKRYAVNPADGSRGLIDGAESSVVGCTGDSSFSYSYIISAADIGTDAKLLFVRVLFPASGTTKLRFALTGVGFANNTLFPQGKYLISEAKSYAGVVKKVQLFQSNPQLPAEFFVTSF